MKVLVVNVGSTSLKFRLFEMPTEVVIAEGKIERVGTDKSPTRYRAGESPWREHEIECRNQHAAIQHALKLMTEPHGGVISGLEEIAAVGFKPVHAKGIADSVFITDAVIEAMEEYVFLAPAHNPPYIEAFRIFSAAMPGKPLVGVFEPAFHSTIPDYARTYGIPYAWTERHAIRRYGFHGASHRYISLRVPQLLGRPAAGMRLVSCHLGGSSSVCAIRDGISVDTSMGLSPQSGLPNAYRNGDLDPFLALYVMEKEGLTAREIAAELCRNGGLSGISGVSGDVRDLEREAALGSARAALALNVLVHETRKYIGAYMAVLEGLDVLAFTGGIGENAVGIRASICAGLDGLGIELDLVRNRIQGSEAIVSKDGSKVTVLVVPTNEEVVIAREVFRLMAHVGEHRGKTDELATTGPVGTSSPPARSPAD